MWFTKALVLILAIGLAGCAGVEYKDPLVVKQTGEIVIPTDTDELSSKLGLQKVYYFDTIYERTTTRMIKRTELINKEDYDKENQ